MPLINWSSLMAVDVAEMDKQHKQLIDIINQLHEAMSSGKANQEIGPSIDRMIKYADLHFQAEEKMLSSAGYPQLTRQKSEHVAFMQKAKEFKRDYEQNKIALSVAVTKYLKDWWTNHIQREDKQYGPFLNGKGIR